MKANGIDNFVSDEDFNTAKYPKAERKAGQFSWGYNDRKLYNQSMDLWENYPKTQPFLSIYQTLSMHSPYNLCEKEYYDLNFIEKRIEALGHSVKLYKKIPPKVIASIVFADDALRSFFERLKEHPQYDNTIFIITGDHAINLNTGESIFENYRIPLIIYSPLLKQSKKFKGVSSHIDILPSLLGLLTHNYGCKFPETKHWIGTGLDTSKQFQADRFSPFNLVHETTPNLMYKDNVIYQGQVLRFDENLNTFPETDQGKVKTISKLFENYQCVNNYVCFKDKIWTHADTSWYNYYFK